MALTTKELVTQPNREIGSANEYFVKTFRALAGTKYEAGTFVNIDTAGRVTINATNKVKIDGIVKVTVDNTNGDNDAVMVPVIVKGNIWSDCIVDSTALLIGHDCSVGGGTASASTGQAVIISATAANNTFTSLSIQAKPSSGNILRKGLFYFRGSGKFI